MTMKSLNLIIRNAKNNNRVALNEKGISDHQNDEDDMNVWTKGLLMRKRTLVLLLMISNISYVVIGGHKKYQCKKYVNEK